MEDLDKLMLYYREWAHYLFPEMKFSDFTTKTRKECSSRMMKQYLHDLRRDGNHGGTYIGASVDFTEFDVGISDIKDIIKKTDAQDTDVADDAGKEKIVEEPIPQDLSDFSFGGMDNYSDEERLLDEMQS